MDSNRLTSSKPRILIVSEAVSLAHVARPVALLQTLDSAKYDLHFAADSRYDNLLPELPVTRHGLTTIESSRFLKALSKGAPIYEKKTLTGYVQEDLELIEKVKPDLIVGDFRLSLSVSARLSKVPYANVTNAYWSPYYREPFPLPDLPMTRSLGIPISRLIFKMTHRLAFGLHTRPFNAVRKSFGLTSLGNDLKRCYTDADYVLYADLPELFPMEKLPRHHHFLGPITWSPDVPLPSWWQNLPTGEPIVYVTLGTTGSRHLLPLVIRSLSQLRVTVLLSTAGKKLSNEISQNAWMADFLPGDKATRASSLVICNGGSLTTNQALAASVPVIGIAGNMDQHLNMEAIVRAGAGHLIRSDQVDTEKFSELVTTTLQSESPNFEFSPEDFNVWGSQTIEKLVYQTTKRPDNSAKVVGS